MFSSLRPKRDVRTAIVTAVEQLTPRMTRVTASAESLVGVDIGPARDIELFLDDDGRRVKRRYTIRQSRPATGEIDVDVFLHGHGPGSRWADGARPGSAMEFVGPRGKLELRPADWHLFLGDEASLPAVTALVEALGPEVDTYAFIEVTDRFDQLPLSARTPRWLHRGSRPAGTPDLLERELDAFTPPEGLGRAYVLTESRVAARLRKLLPSYGVAADNVFAKGYWNSPS
ncbi:siderophore-interacting protein [Streptomyces sp. NRRL WC-3742]|uniref:siderophore-interacting protein n=1 Tax=Streptomyces sp. NRRL WC-3742 TaxID=1463934 RepID=UPI0004C4B8C6|nr:siderophore-interacting protein [Streptomyces sp. NRRL WC-3742]